MKNMVVIFGVTLVCAIGCNYTAMQRNTAMRNVDNDPDTCNAPNGIMCMADKVTTPDSGLDHTDALGYSGAAFRIHTLPREVLCPSTVSPRFGYKPQMIDQRPTDPLVALRQAKMLAETGKFGEYVSGQRAYDFWIELLEAEEGSQLLTEQKKAHAEDSGLPVMNTYCFLSLLHAREAAGPFLRRRGTGLDGNAGRLVVKAATCYDRVVEALKSVGRPAWEQRSRKKQADALREAKAFEEQAGVLLGQAIAELGDTGRAQ